MAWPLRWLMSCGTLDGTAFRRRRKVIIGNNGSAPRLLATAAQSCGADLVVLGAYGHSELREVLFGGCTRAFIRDADRPVLLMH
jgi:nucleotide-binding universal stress UspA family protein